MLPTLIRIPAVLKSAGFSRSTLYLKIKKGLWPAPVKIGDRAKAWPEREINEMVNAFIEEKSNDEIRKLVITLCANRKDCK